MRCEQARAELTALMDDELGGFGAWRIRRHVASCRDCALELNSLQSLNMQLMSADMFEESYARPVVADKSPVRYQKLVMACGLVVSAIYVIGMFIWGNWFNLKPIEMSQVGTRHISQPPIVSGQRNNSAGSESLNRLEPGVNRPNLPAVVQKGHEQSRQRHEIASIRRSTVNAPVPDMQYLNTDPMATMARWTATPQDQLALLQQNLDKTIKEGDSFVSVPFPKVASNSASALAAAAEAYKQEKEVIDPRLTRTVSLSAKAMAFSDLCKQWTQETGIEFSANRGVADDKITAFCRKKPLRDVMRQINRLFAFSWRRSGEPGQYKYELAQDLRSQIMEEELRNRDRDEGLLGIDKQMEAWRKYAHMTPEEVEAAAQKTEDKDEKLRLFSLMSSRLALNKLYFTLSPEQLTSLRDGNELSFSTEPERGQLPLSPQLAQWGTAHMTDTLIPGKPVTATFKLDKSELGQFTLMGHVYAHVKIGENGYSVHGQGAYMAQSKNARAKDPNNEEANAAEANNPTLQGRVDIKPEPTCKYDRGRYANFTSTDAGPKVTIADVLETIHKETGRDIIADHFTRLYAPDNVSAKDTKLFGALNHLCDTMKVRWSLEDGWIRTRSLTFFHDRLKEVPERLLERWAASRRKNGMATLDDIVEMAQLSDAQLDSEPITVGAMACYDLKEWGFAAMKEIREHWRFLARLTGSSRQAAFSEKGLAYATLPLSQRQQMITLAFGEQIDRIRPDYDDLNGAIMRVRMRKPDSPAQPDDERGFPYFANPVQIEYLNKDRWHIIQGPFNGLSRLPR